MGYGRQAIEKSYRRVSTLREVRQQVFWAEKNCISQLDAPSDGP
jgi:hypothetical protein